ncbi:MAG: hypothetical protein JWP29_3426, partial [Rhodoferax sp.]|nr:hypothetical protein [Rhodoferax sp.]
MHVFEWILQRPDGACWDALVHLMMFNFGGKDLLQFTLEDITERKRADKQLLFARRVVDNTGPMLWHDPQTSVVLYANKAAARHLGTTPVECIGRRMEDFAPEFSQDAFAALIGELRTSGQNRVVETRHQRADGSSVDAEVYCFLAESDDGERLVTSIKDITEQKRAQAVMLHAKEAAEEATRVKSEFLANM